MDPDKKVSGVGRGESTCWKSASLSYRFLESGCTKVECCQKRKSRDEEGASGGRKS